MNKENILTLLNTSKIGSRTVQFIAKKYDEYQVHDYRDLVSVLKEANKINSRIPIVSEVDLEIGYGQANRILEISAQHDVDVISYMDLDYPTRYKDISNPPSIIYSKGNKKALNNQKTVAIIGTREPTEFGARAGERLGEIFAANDFTVVSGLAIGCDSVAHKGCLKAKGITVGVMAGGLDKIYPKENKMLAEEIIDNNGCLISEHPIGEKPRASSFVERDRLQSGLSQAVIVVETDVKGGTMHTVKFAEEQNRFLACLWNHPDRLQSHPKVQGNRKLVSEQKAKSLGSKDDIDVFISFLSDKQYYSNIENWHDLLLNNFNFFNNFLRENLEKKYDEAIKVLEKKAKSEPGIGKLSDNDTQQFSLF